MFGIKLGLRMGLMLVLMLMAVVGQKPYTVQTPALDLPNADFEVLTAACGHRGSLTFLDYNLDARWDMLYTGEASFCGSECAPSIRLYKNVPTFIWEEEQATVLPTVPGLVDSSVDSGDINGDNYPDLVICGDQALPPAAPSPMLQVLLNPGAAGGAFVQVGGTFPQVYKCKVRFTDCDGDNNDEIIITGETAGGAQVFAMFKANTCTDAASCTFADITSTAFATVPPTLRDVILEDGDMNPSVDTKKDFYYGGFHSNGTVYGDLFINSGSCTYSKDNGNFDALGKGDAVYVAKGLTNNAANPCMLIAGTSADQCIQGSANPQNKFSSYCWNGAGYTAADINNANTYCDAGVTAYRDTTPELYVYVGGITGGDGSILSETLKISDTGTVSPFAVEENQLDMLVKPSAAMADFNNDGARDLAVAGHKGPLGYTLNAGRTGGSYLWTGQTEPPSAGGVLRLYTGTELRFKPQTDRLLPPRPTTYTNARMAVGTFQVPVDTGCPDLIVTGQLPFTPKNLLLKSVNQSKPCNYDMINQTPVAFVLGPPEGVRTNVKWFDLNADGFNDLIYAGVDVMTEGLPAADRMMKVFINEQVGTFNAVPGTSSAFSNNGGFEDGIIAAADINKDGLLDIIATGLSGAGQPSDMKIVFIKSSLNAQSKLQYADDNTFVAGIPPVFRGDAQLGFVDSDDNPDLVIIGARGPSKNLTALSATAMTRVFLGTGTGFTDATATILPGVPDLYDGQVFLFDFDGVGGLDIFLTGTTDGTTGYLGLFLNTNPGSAMTDVSATVLADIPTVFRTGATWGDYDVSGSADLFLIGTTDGYNGYIGLWNNNGAAAAMTDVSATLLPADVPKTSQGMAAFADFGNPQAVPGGLDLLMFGTQGCPVTALLAQGNPLDTTTTGDSGGDGGVDPAIIGGAIGGGLGGSALLLLCLLCPAACLLVCCVVCLLCVGLLLVLGVAALVVAFVVIATGIAAGSGAGGAAAIVWRRNKNKDWDDYDLLDVNAGGVDLEEVKRKMAETTTFRELRLEDLNFGRKIGEGAYGAVFLGEWQNAPVAIKVLHMDVLDEAAMNEFRNEATMMAKVAHHPNVIQFVGAVISEEKLCLITHFCKKGSLLVALKARPLPNLLKVRICRDSAAGLAFLHAQGIVHRDIAARNVLLGENYEAFISDFGYSRLYSADEVEGKQTKSNVGPVRWMSPEALQKKVYSQKTDCYSFGVLIWEIAADGATPYPQHPNLIDLIMAVLQDGIRPEIPPDTDPTLVALMNALWATDPADRPSMADVHRVLRQRVEELTEGGAVVDDEESSMVMSATDGASSTYQAVLREGDSEDTSAAGYGSF